MRVVLFLGLLANLVVATEPVVKVLNGSYSGIHLPQYHQDLFLGIPYAQDTGGANRFRIPQSLNATWDGIKPAVNYSNACPSQSASDMVYGMSENCLSINVVRPSKIADNVTLPVLLWIHGGSYQVGSSGLPNYNLTFIVQRSIEIGKPIVAASINYRKGGWGNMYSVEIQGSGNTNLALRDMRKGLAWMQENIEAFGGDKSRVTIWGESAGSFAVGQLLMTYGGRTDGLFHRSIQESGSAATAWYNGTDWYQPIYNKIVDQSNCTEAIDTLECLRTLHYETIYPFLNSSAVTPPGWYPTVDGDIMPNYPTVLLEAGRFAHIPHLYGSNSDEGTDNAPFGINTDEDLRDYLLYDTGFQFPNSTVTEIMSLYQTTRPLVCPSTQALSALPTMDTNTNVSRRLWAMCSTTPPVAMTCSTMHATPRHMPIASTPARGRTTPMRRTPISREVWRQHIRVWSISVRSHLSSITQPLWVPIQNIRR